MNLNPRLVTQSLKSQKIRYAVDPLIRNTFVTMIFKHSEWILTVKTAFLFNLERKL